MQYFRWNQWTGYNLLSKHSVSVRATDIMNELSIINLATFLLPLPFLSSVLCSEDKTEH